MSMCECGCGKETKHGNRFIHGHHICKIPWTPIPEPMLCECGCGEYAKPGKRFIHGHSSHNGRQLQEKTPLPNGWVSKNNSKMATNKYSASWLGCYITEQVLMKMFKNVKAMPYGNHGYDFICGIGDKIDVKSSATGDALGRWAFGINKNTLADRFILVAFDNREDLNPVHTWMIHGNVINHLTNLSVHKSTINKWSQYELPIDRMIECCDTLRGN